jgi:hypothetical protein
MGAARAMPWALTPTNRTVYFVPRLSPATRADTGTGRIPTCSCCAHGIVEPSGVAGEIVNWQLVTRAALGLSLPRRVALVAVRAVGGRVRTVGRGSFQKNLTVG